MAVKKSNKKIVKALFARSKICAFFMKIASFLYGKAESSLTGKLFSGYDESAFEKGLLGRLTRKADLGKRFFRPMKRGASRLVSQSFLLRTVNGYLRGFLNTKLNVYGLFFVTTGVGFLLVELLKGYALFSSELSFLDVFVSVLSLLISVPLLFSSSTLTSAVCRSKAASSIVFCWLGCRREVFEKQNEGVGHTKTALIAGIIFCFMSWWIRPVMLFVFLIVCVFATAVFYIPETGVVGLIFLLPFLSAEKLNCLIVFIAVCFLFKYIRGKRTVKFDPLGIAVLMFAVLCWFSGVTSTVALPSQTAMWNMIGCIGSFFLVINLIKSKKWIERCLISLYASLFLVVLYGLARYVSSRLGIAYLISLFECIENEYMAAFFGSSDIFCNYLVMALPFSVVGLNSDRKNSRTASFFALILGAVCLILTYEYKAWVSVLVGVIIFLIFYGKKTLAVMLFIICSLPLVFFYLPQPVQQSVSVLSRVSDTVAVGVESALAGARSDSLSYFCGTGLGTFDSAYPISGISYGVSGRLIFEIGIIGFLMFVFVLFLYFQKNTTLYARGCSKQGKLISLASMTAIISVLSMGADTNIFGNYTVTLMFWICLGLASCVSVTERKIIGFEEYEEYDKGELL